MPVTEDLIPNTACPVCGLSQIDALVELRQIPVHCNVLWPTQAEALQAPKGDLRLGFCRGCSHLFNRSFDPGLMEYTQAYENSLHFSPRFQQYARALAARLIERYNLRGQTVIELGCGKGEFLGLLAEMGGNRCVGFDPSYVPDANLADARITVIRDFYSERYADYQADFICCRHVLEHIQFPCDFLAGLRRSIGERLSTVVYFEVPNSLYTLRDMGIWDLIYEHCSYFSANSLARLFTDCGFEVLEVAEAYGGQFLTLEARPRGDAAFQSAPRVNDLQAMASSAAAFAERYQSKVATWAAELEQMAHRGRRVVVWGAGSKGVTFLNMLKVQSQVDYVVDLNPRKQEMYVAGTGQCILAPKALPTHPVDVVLVMNPIYLDEIQRIVERLGLTPELVCV